MNLTNYYNTNIVGHYPGNENSIQTTCTIEYLIDCGFPEKEILKIMNEITPRDALVPDMLPENLWNNSLLKKGDFYLHKELRLNPAGPVIDSKTGKEISSNLYNEMKIRYTTKDLLNYFYETLKIMPELRHEKRDMAQFSNLIERYGRFDNVRAVEIMLDIIDQISFEHKNVFTPFDLDVSWRVMEAYERLKYAKMKPDATIMWRKEPAKQLGE